MRGSSRAAKTGVDLLQLAVEGGSIRVAAGLGTHLGKVSDGPERLFAQPLSLKCPVQLRLPLLDLCRPSAAAPETGTQHVLANSSVRQRREGLLTLLWSGKCQLAGTSVPVAGVVENGRIAYTAILAPQFLQLRPRPVPWEIAEEKTPSRGGVWRVLAAGQLDLGTVSGRLPLLRR